MLDEGCAGDMVVGAFVGVSCTGAAVVGRVVGADSGELVTGMLIGVAKGGEVTVFVGGGKSRGVGEVLTFGVGSEVVMIGA